MSEHLSEEQMNGYREKRLAPKDLIRVDKHLSICEACREKLNGDSERVRVWLEQEFAGQPEHLTYDQLAAYLDKKPEAEHEQAESHLEVCSRCKAEYEDLRAFSLEMSGAKAHSGKWIYRLVAVAAVIALIALVAVLEYRESYVPQQQQITRPIPLIVSIVDAGTRITLDRNGKLSGLNHAPANHQQLVRNALQSQQLEIGKSVDSLITQQGFVRGESNKGVPFRLVKPVGTMVASDRPVFQWNPLPGATKYRVTVLDTNMNVAGDSGWVTTTTWIANRPLRRDSTYIWQVAALQNNIEILSPQPPAAEARFRVLDEHTHALWEKEQVKYAGSLLLPGLLDAQYGLLDDAQHKLQELAKANPDSPEIQKLLENLKK